MRFLILYLFSLLIGPLFLYFITRLIFEEDSNWIAPFVLLAYIISIGIYWYPARYSESRILEVSAAASAGLGISILVILVIDHFQGSTEYSAMGAAFLYLILGPLLALLGIAVAVAIREVINRDSGTIFLGWLLPRVTRSILTANLIALFPTLVTAERLSYGILAYLFLTLPISSLMATACCFPLGSLFFRKQPFQS